MLRAYAATLIKSKLRINLLSWSMCVYMLAIKRCCGLQKHSITQILFIINSLLAIKVYVYAANQFTQMQYFKPECSVIFPTIQAMDIFCFHSMERHLYGTYLLHFSKGERTA